ncbi:Mitogen-activated protein kinase [Irineochytrium annulatum]|nr:Mitogen-activated protein kinase [Irineochytrium annulatum]
MSRPSSSGSTAPAMVPAIASKYKFTREIGMGAYGVVWAAVNNETGEHVAIKKVGAKNFQEEILAKRALRELKLLRHLNGHDNVASFVDCDINDPRNFNEIYLVEGLMETDLSHIIKSKQALTEQHYQYFIYQILRGLKWMHSADVLHRDLKPGNLLINSDCELKICDFGLARGAQHSFVQTEYVATRYYRAAEVILSPKHYSKALDIWSVGCIYGELMLGKILFVGKDYIDQLQKIFEFSGTPSDPTLTHYCSARVLKYLKSWPERKKANLQKFFPKGSKEGLDLLDKLLTFDPRNRITAAEALRHPWLSAYHQSNDEPDCPSVFDSSFESVHKIPDVKKLIIAEVNDFKASMKGGASKRVAGKPEKSLDIARDGPKRYSAEEEEGIDAAMSLEDELEREYQTGRMKGLDIRD